MSNKNKKNNEQTQNRQEIEKALKTASAKKSTKVNEKKSYEFEDILKSNYDTEPFFSLLDLFFERDKRILVKHHIDSFNQFISEIIPDILQGGDNIISEKISENKVIRYRLTFDDLGIKPPANDSDDEPIFPLDAITKNLSYSAKYTATVTQWQDIVDINTQTTTTKIIGEPEPDVPIAKIPIMVGSNYCNLNLQPELAKKHCPYDAGGYFIVNGSEKVVMSVESMILRKPLVFTEKDQNSLIYYVKVHSRPATQFVGNPQIFSIKLKKDNNLVVIAPRLREVNVFTLMRALGIETDEDIVNSILDTKREKSMMNRLMISMNIPNAPCITREEAISNLTYTMRSTKTYSDSDPEIRAQQKKAYLMRVLSQELLPHVTSGTNDPDIDMLYKAHYIGYMIHKLLECVLKGGRNVEEFRGCDERDNMVNKRIELTGILLGGLFEQFFKKLLNDCNKIFRSKNVDDRKPPNIILHIKPNSIEQGLRKALSTGEFGSQSRKGLSQMLNRINHSRSSAYMRRVITPTTDAATNKLTGPRHLHNTQYGSMCPLETPEGPKTGFVKNLTLTEGITISLKDQIQIVESRLEGKIISLESVNKNQLHTYVKVFINGNWMGVTNRIIEIHNDLRAIRYKGELDKTVSLVLDYKEKEYHVYTDGGRLIRPYLTVTGNQLNFKSEMLDDVTSWDEFIAKYPGIIEYIDKEEEQNIMLAVSPQYIDESYRIMNKKPITKSSEIDKINRTNRYDDNVYVRYTHCEIHPSMILGVISSNIPFPNHNQSPRGIYQYSQAGAALGLYISDYRYRTDISYILYHSQIPIVASRASKYTGTHIFPAGENCIVAIISYGGYNQEDSLLMCRSAVEKGLFRAQALKKYFETIKKNLASSQTGIFMKPDRDKVDNIKDANYNTLTEEGYAAVETVIKDGDVIIGMVEPKATSSEKEKPYRDRSTIYKSLIPGAIDKVITGTNNDGYPIIKIRVRSERIPEVGDKFSCYDETTQVLTQRGWTNFDTLRSTDRVATLTDNGDKLIYECPSDIQKYKYDGTMYQVHTDEVDLCVTLNHKMWVSATHSHPHGKFELTETSHVYRKPMLYQKAVCGGIRSQPDVVLLKRNDDNIGFTNFLRGILSSRKAVPEISVNPNTDGYVVDTDAWLSFYATWLRCGYVERDSNTITFPNVVLDATHGIKTISENLNNVSPCYINIVENTDTNHHVHAKTTFKVQIESEYLANIVRPMDIAFSERTLADWVYRLNHENSRKLLNNILREYEIRENVKDGKRVHTFYTRSNEMADAIQKLCLHAGCAGDIYKVTYGSADLSAYAIDITNGDNVSVNFDHNVVCDSTIRYSGYVYCCTVSSGVICVRRNGKIVFCGNSRAGQKATVGYRPHRADMPFSISGLIPDIAINPNAITKRMTIGQLIECLLAKLCARKGIYGDATPFNGVSIDEINNELISYGFNAWGTETMYNGLSGQKMDVEIFCGPTYYQRLKQMVGDKTHSRAHGTKQLLTRQPPEGRSRDGGLRIGEMERDAILAHGCSQFLKERLVDNSDIYTTHICDICGLFASKVPGKKYYKCAACDNTSLISKIVIPYAFKLFLQELRSINILASIITDKSVTLPRRKA